MVTPDASVQHPPELSVSVIVRNEAQRLPTFLDDLAPLRCEVCLVDTGSSDDTVAIARSRGLTVHTFPWCDDFSAARNAALAHCRGEWVLSLDADERIAPEDVGALSELIHGPRDIAYRLTTRNYSTNSTVSGYVAARLDDPNAAGYPGWFPSTKVRLFPRIPGIGFEGAVHELIGPSLERKGIRMATADIPIHHYPMRHRSEADQLKKQHFYLELGKQKIAQNPSDPKAHNELGDQYVDLGEIGLALKSYKEAVRLDPGNAHWLKGLGSALLLAGQTPQATQALRMSLQRDADQEECWRNLGVAYVQAGDWTQAREAFEQALDAAPDHPENQRYLAIARHSCGDTTGAIALLERLLGAWPDHGDARALYASLMEFEGKKEEGQAFLSGLRR